MGPLRSPQTLFLARCCGSPRLNRLTSLELLERQFGILSGSPESTHGQHHQLDQGLYPTENQLGALALVQTSGRMWIHQLTDGE